MRHIVKLLTQAADWAFILMTMMMYYSSEEIEVMIFYVHVPHEQVLQYVELSFDVFITFGLSYIPELIFRMKEE